MYGAATTLEKSDTSTSKVSETVVFFRLLKWLSETVRSSKNKQYRHRPDYQKGYNDALLDVYLFLRDGDNEN